MLIHRIEDSFTAESDPHKDFDIGNAEKITNSTAESHLTSTCTGSNTNVETCSQLEFGDNARDNLPTDDLSHEGINDTEKFVDKAGDETDVVPTEEVDFETEHDQLDKLVENPGSSDTLSAASDQQQQLALEAEAASQNIGDEDLYVGPDTSNDDDEITYDDDDHESDLRTPLKQDFATHATTDTIVKRSWQESEGTHDLTTSTNPGEFTYWLSHCLSLMES